MSELHDGIKQFAAEMHGNRAVIDELIELLTLGFNAYCREMLTIFGDRESITYNVRFTSPIGEIYMRLRRVTREGNAYIHSPASTIKLRVSIREASGQYALGLWFGYDDEIGSDAVCYHEMGRAINLPTLLLTMLEYTHVEDTKDAHRLSITIHTLRSCMTMA